MTGLWVSFLAWPWRARFPVQCHHISVSGGVSLSGLGLVLYLITATLSPPPYHPLRSLGLTKDEINVPIALRAFRDKPLVLGVFGIFYCHWSLACLASFITTGPWRVWRLVSPLVLDVFGVFYCHWSLTCLASFFLSPLVLGVFGVFYPYWSLACLAYFITTGP